MPSRCQKQELIAEVSSALPRGASWIRELGLAIFAAALLLAGCGTDVQPQPYTGGGLVPNGGGIGGSDAGDIAGQGPSDTLQDVQSLADGQGSKTDVAGASGGDTEAGSDATGPLDTYTPPTGPACAKASGCTNYPLTPWCDFASQTCVECVVDFHCAKTTGHCQNKKCQEISCVPGASACESGFLKVCNADGKGYTKSACDDPNPICYDGKCRKCTPDENYCASPQTGQTDSTVLLKCNKSGSDADILKICKTGEICAANDCRVCVPGQTQCTGNKGMTCDEKGKAWVVTSDCDKMGLVCLGGLCVNPCDSDFKANTNVGCDYWAVDLDNALVSGAGGKVYDAQNSQFSVIVSNTKNVVATVTVVAGTGQKAKYSVQPNALKIINLPDPKWKVKPLNQDGTSVNKRAYRIKSNQPIVAYQFNPLQNVDVFSNDASLLLPSNSVGNEYWVMTRQQTHSTLRGYFTVIATQQGITKVKVLVSTKTLASKGGLQSVPPGPWGSIKSFSLNEGEVLNVETDANGADMTGTWIQADKPVAVFGGSEASNSPNTNKCVKAPAAPSGTCQYQGWACKSNADCPVTCCADHLEEQLMPVKAWGKSYVATKSKKRGSEKDSWRIVAASNGTVVQTNPPQAPIPTLNQGQWFEFESSQDFTIMANKPIQVGQFLASSHAPNPNNDLCNEPYGNNLKICSTMYKKFKTKIQCKKHADCPNIAESTDAKIGDPAFIVTISDKQFLGGYVFLVPNKYKENYINIVAKPGTVVKLDTVIVQASAFKQFAGGQWSVARLPISQGAHKLDADKPVGLVVYGWDNYVSYGYPGGAALGGD